MRNFSSFRAEPANVELQSSGAILARLLRGGFWEVLRCAKEEYETARRNTASISFFMSEISLSRLSGRDGHILHTLQPGERGTSVRRPVKGLRHFRQRLCHVHRCTYLRLQQHLIGVTVRPRSEKAASRVMLAPSSSGLSRLPSNTVSRMRFFSG